MKTAYFWIISLVLIGVAISFYFLPTGEDLALIHLKSQKYSSAESFYREQYQQGVRSPTVVNELSVLYEKEGNLEEAIKIINEYVEAHPDDYAALKRLAELYALNNQFDEHGAILVRMNQFNENTEPDVLRELKDYYYEKGDLVRRKIVLNQLIKTGKANANDYAELAKIYSDEKKYDEAAAVLLTRRLYFPTHETLDTVLFELWINGHLKKPFDKDLVPSIAAYLKKKNNPQLTLYLMNVFKESYPQLALEFVSLMQPTFTNNLNLKTTALLIKWDHPELKAEVQQDLKNLEEEAKTNTLLSNFLFEVYSAHENDQDLVRLIQEIPPEKIDEQRIIDLATLILLNDRPFHAQDIQTALGKEYLDKHPLSALALSVAAREKGAREAFTHFSESPLERTDRFLLFRIASAAGYEKESLELGKSLFPFAGMREETLLEIAESYMQMKQGDELVPLITEAWPSIGNNGIAALALLSIGSPHPQEAKAWIQSQNKIKEPVLRIFFEEAKNYKEYDLALFVAEKLHSDFPSVASDSSYGLAQVLTGKVEAGIRLLKQLYEAHPTTPQLQRDYFTGLLAAVKFDKRYKAELSAYMASREQQGEIPKNLRKEFAYIYLEDLKNYAKAEAFFFELANESPQDPNDVETLLYLWGPYVTEEQGAWIERQADLASSDEELSRWLENLNQIGRYQSALALFQTKAVSPSIKTYFAYMQALAEVKCYTSLREAIDRVAPCVETLKQLKELANLAEIASHYETRIALWERIVSLRPCEAKVWQGYARALFDARSYCQTIQALETFFSLTTEENPKLYEALYQYAESLRKERYFLLSSQYYCLTLKTIAAAEERTARVQEIAALSYYQLNCNKKGICIMKQYFEDTGRDPDAGAAFANLLMDYGRLRQTQKLFDCLFCW